MSTKPVFRFGLIGDIQYAVDVESALNFTGSQVRLYHDALLKLRKAVNHWNQLDLSFCVNLGDILDGRNATKNTTKKAWETMAAELKPLKHRRIDIIGNHELYNWPTRKSMPKELNVSQKVENGIDRTWYSFCPAKGWRVLVLDTFLFAAIDGTANEEMAKKFIGQFNPNALDLGADWMKGLSPNLMNMVPYNGGLGKEQLAWIDKQLGDAKEKGERVIMFSHNQFATTSNRPIDKTVVLDYKQFEAVLAKHVGVTVAAFSGHSHEGGTCWNSELQYHQFLPYCPIIQKRGSPCHGFVDVFEDRIVINGESFFGPNHDANFERLHTLTLNLNREAKTNQPMQTKTFSEEKEPDHDGEGSGRLSGWEVRAK